MFRVCFTAGEEPAVRVVAQRPGIRLLDVARVALGERVTYADLEDLPEMEQDVEVELTEEDARYSGLFARPHGEVAFVYVPPGALTRFVRFEPVPDELSGKIWWNATIDTDAIVDEWREDGRPTYWMPR